MFSLKMSQAATIVQLLRTTDDSNDEQLIETIMKDAQVTREIANAYLCSWRHNNHDAGEISMTVKRVDLESKLAALVRQPKAEVVIVGDAAPLEGEGKIEAIIRLHQQGYSNAQIIEAGYNKSTVGRQVGEYKKRTKETAKN